MNFDLHLMLPQLVRWDVAAVNYSRLSSSTAYEMGAGSGSCVCSSGKNGSVNPWG